MRVTEQDKWNRQMLKVLKSSLKQNYDEIIGTALYRYAEALYDSGEIDNETDEDDILYLLSGKAYDHL